MPLSNSNAKPADVILTARAWGDINGMMFNGLGFILISAAGMFGSKKNAKVTNPAETEVMKRILNANFMLALCLLAFATFHHVVLHHGPPPPVFIAAVISGVVSYRGARYEEASGKKK